MTYDEARRAHDAFLLETRHRAPRLVPLDWQRPARVEEQANSWLFVYKEADPSGPEPGSYEAVVVRKDRTGPFVLLGAIGRTFRTAGTDLGLPRSNERWLGSGPGRYQAFDSGLLVWHEDPGLAYGRRVPAETLTGRRCLAAVAFLDLRGFSRWARRRNPRDVQTLMSSLEGALQDAFNATWCRLLFVKGVGDGAMIVSERDWFLSAEGHGSLAGLLHFPLQLHRGHLSALLRACARVVLAGRAILPSELAIGCGLDIGELNQVFLFGQADYLGEPANDAAKLQRLAWDEIIVSTRFGDLLARSGEECSDLVRDGVPLADRGIRINPALCAGITGP